MRPIDILVVALAGWLNRRQAAVLSYLREENRVLQFVAHYLSERNHQGIGNRLIAPTSSVGSVIGRVRKKERLGGLLNLYHRAA